MDDVAISVQLLAPRMPRAPLDLSMAHVIRRGSAWRSLGVEKPVQVPAAPAGGFITSASSQRSSPKPVMVGRVCH